MNHDSCIQLPDYHPNKHRYIDPHCEGKTKKHEWSSNTTTSLIFLSFTKAQGFYQVYVYLSCFSSDSLNRSIGNSPDFWVRPRGSITFLHLSSQGTRVGIQIGGLRDHGLHSACAVDGHLHRDILDLSFPVVFQEILRWLKCGGGKTMGQVGKSEIRKIRIHYLNLMIIICSK